MLQSQEIPCHFIFFQPCEACIDPSSPSRKLNDRYAKFAKEKFPQLYQKIIDEGKKRCKSIWIICLKNIIPKS